MKKLITEIRVGSSLFSEFSLSQRGDPFSGSQGTQKLDRVRIPRVFREDEVLASLIDQYKSDWSAFESRSRELRQQLAYTAEEKKAALVERLHDLMRSNQQTHNKFMRALRERMRELRFARDEQSLSVGDIL